MPRRAAMVTQADIARTIRALRDAGLPVARVVVRPDGVSIETSGGPGREEAIATAAVADEAQRAKIIL